MKGVGNIDFNDEFSEEILNIKNLKMELAMQIISNDRNLTNSRVQNLKGFTTQVLSTQAKKGEQLVSLMPAIMKTFHLMGNDTVKLSTENNFLVDKMVCYDENWL